MLSSIFVTYLPYSGRPGRPAFQFQRKRLARALLLLAQFGKDGTPETVIPRIKPGSAGGDGGHNVLTGELLHESFP
jgi:hypothetical protein